MSQLKLAAAAAGRYWALAVTQAPARDAMLSVLVARTCWHVCAKPQAESIAGWRDVTQRSARDWSRDVTAHGCVTTAPFRLTAAIKARRRPVRPDFDASLRIPAIPSYKLVEHGAPCKTDQQPVSHFLPTRRADPGYLTRSRPVRLTLDLGRWAAPSPCDLRDSGRLLTGAGLVQCILRYASTEVICSFVKTFQLCWVCQVLVLTSELIRALAVSEPEDQPSPSAAASSAGSEPSTELESASQALATIGAAPSETMLLLESPQRDDNHDVIVVDCSLSTSGAAIGYGQRGHDR
ncbi:hypothetical protein MRX96_032280 [Rhipicephalus microplus]